MISTRPLDPHSAAGGSRPYVRLPQTSLDQLQEQADGLVRGGAQDSCNLSVNERGLNVDGDGPVLPLKLGALQKALGEIEDRQGWLTDRPGVSIYQDVHKRPHIDVINFGGFILAGDGRIESSSINAW